MRQGLCQLTTKAAVAMIIWGLAAILIAMSFASCGSEEKVAIQSCERVWNVDEDLQSAFWGAVNLMESHGVNIIKLQEESLNVYLVDEFSGGDPDDKTVAMATLGGNHGINIEVLRSKWKTTKYVNELSQRNMLTMLHEIGHDYFDLSHHEGEWDIMNAIGIEGDEISDNDISNSLNRMIIEGRRNYDKEALRKRF